MKGRGRKEMGFIGLIVLIGVMIIWNVMVKGNMGEGFGRVASE